MISSISSWVYPFCLTILVGIAAVLFHLNPDNFLADDAYFYPQIAQQIINGNGSTFHQYSLTNGYHPLWMAFSVIAAWIAQGDKMLLLHLLGGFQAILFTTTLYFLFKIAGAANLRFFGVGVVFLTVLMLTVGGLRLFEAHLAITLQMAAFYVFLIFWRSTPSAYALAAYSFLLGLIFLARTDAFFLSAALGAALGIKVLFEEKRVKERCFHIFALAFPAILVAIAYMAFNKFTFGHPVPISGVIKSSYPQVQFDWHALGTIGVFVVGITLAILIVSIVLAKRQKEMRVLFIVAFVGIFFHALYIVCFSWGSQWYYTTAFAVFPIALLSVLTDVSRRLEYRSSFSVFVCTVALCILAMMDVVGYLKTRSHFSVSLVLLGKQTFQPDTEKSARLKLVDAINQNLAAGTGVAVFDSPGVLAYFSHARILPLDGLVNDRNYDEMIVKDGFMNYLKQQDIHYFIAPALPENGDYHSSTLQVTRKNDVQYNIVYAPIQKISAGSFPLKDDQIVFESPNPIPGTHGFDSVACWHLYTN